MTFSLFNQRTSGEKSWQGDWLFRRERLALVDQGLQAARPDLVFFQQLMSRRGSPSESDRSILSYGALNGYSWQLNLDHFYEDVQEVQAFGIAYGLPLEAGEQGQNITGNLGKGGGFSISKVYLEAQPLWLVNVEMPYDSENVDSWYTILEQQISEFSVKNDLCTKRLIIAGYLPGRVSWPNYQRFLNRFQLKDTSSGFCELTQSCMTASPKNEIFAISQAGKSGSQVDRILAHKEAVVYQSKLQLANTADASPRSQSYGLRRIWPSQRMAWNSILRLPRCP